MMFFQRKIFTLRRLSVEKLAAEELRGVDWLLSLDAMRYIQHILAPIPTESSICNTLALAQYHRFPELQRLSISLMAWDRCFHGTQMYFEVPGEMLELLKALGLDVPSYKMDTTFKDGLDASEKFEDFTWVVVIRSFGHDVFRMWHEARGRQVPKGMELNDYGGFSPIERDD